MRNIEIDDGQLLDAMSFVGSAYRLKKIVRSFHGGGTPLFGACAFWRLHHLVPASFCVPASFGAGVAFSHADFSTANSLKIKTVCMCFPLTQSFQAIVAIQRC